MYKGMKRIVARLLALLLLVFALPALAEDEPPRIPLGDLAPAGVALPGDGKYDVYAGPGVDYLRPAGGKASVSAKGWVLTFGVEDGWTLIAYQVGDYQYRFGWIKGEAAAKELAFERVPAAIKVNSPFTDDPLGKLGALASLKKGTPVIRLAKMGIWAYVETEIGGVKARGFVPSGVLEYVYNPLQYENCLYPIRENGKWGYMNCRRETVIHPTWAYAGKFAYGVAMVSTEDNVLFSSKGSISGLIDAAGAYILQPAYRIDRNGAFLWVAAPGEGDAWLEGYYDALSGCFLPPAYDMFNDWAVTDDTLLILAVKDGRYGFLDRASGKEAIAPKYSGLVDACGYSEGYILAADEVCLEGGGFTFRTYLLDMAGNQVQFPEGITASSGVHGGLLRIEREAKEDESSQWGTLYGFAKPDGSIVVPPKYDYAEDFCEGYACVYKDGKWGHIDEAGREIVPPAYKLETGGGLLGYSFHNGYAILELSDRWIILDTAGNVAFECACKENGMYFSLEGWCGLGGGLVWYSQWSEKDGWEQARYGLMKADGAIVTQAIWEGYVQRDAEDGITYPQEGLQAVKLFGLWGYIDASGGGNLPFVWDYAENFENGLALVEKDGKMAYIDHSGKVVWREK